MISCWYIAQTPHRESCNAVTLRWRPSSDFFLCGKNDFVFIFFLNWFWIILKKHLFYQNWFYSRENWFYVFQKKKNYVLQESMLKWCGVLHTTFLRSALYIRSLTDTSFRGGTPTDTSFRGGPPPLCPWLIWMVCWILIFFFFSFFFLQIK